MKLALMRRGDSNEGFGEGIESDKQCENWIGSSSSDRPSLSAVIRTPSGRARMVADFTGTSGVDTARVRTTRDARSLSFRRSSSIVCWNPRLSITVVGLYVARLGLGNSYRRTVSPEDTVSAMTSAASVFETSISVMRYRTPSACRSGMFRRYTLRKLGCNVSAGLAKSALIRANDCRETH